MQPLPIDALVPEIVASLRGGPNVVVEAPPGAGKTTRVPPALLDAGLAGEGEVWVLEPRRLAARMSARRVAEERGERLGETVGYQVRFEDVSSPRTRLRFLTEGVLTRRLLSDPNLARAGVVILDEFHERHLQADLALALLRRLQRTTRPNLRLVAMSATLDAAPVASYLGGCPVLRSEGRRFEVEIEHARLPDERPLAEQVELAVARLLREGLAGDALVFLPGAAEIRRAQEALARLAAEQDLLVLPLHGELPAAEQDRAVRPAERRKIILSTNVAETSVTIEGVVAVVDSGLARVAAHSPWSGLPTLQVARVSQASAAQRAGRAGRTRPGRALRLYTAQDFAARPAHETPEVRRVDLAEPALELHAAGVRDLRAFDWFEAPAAEALDAAESLLRRLGALGDAAAGGGVTATGRRMLRLPLHPRLSRLVVEADARGVAPAACVIAALVSERDIRERNVFADGRERQRAPRRHGSSDLLELYDLFAEAARTGFAPERLRGLGLDTGSVRAVERVRRQLQRAVSARPFDGNTNDDDTADTDTNDGDAADGGTNDGGKIDDGTSRMKIGGGASRTKIDDSASRMKVSESASRMKISESASRMKIGEGASRVKDEGVAWGELSAGQEEALLVSVLAGYPDRVARRREAAKEARAGAVELLLAGGGGVELAPESVVRRAEFLVAVDAGARQRSSGGAGGAGGAGRRGAATLVRLASAIEPEWLLDLFPDRIAETTEARWNAQGERVETYGRLLYDQLVLTESRSTDARGAEVTRVLAEAALAAGVEAFADREGIESFLARIEFLSRAVPEAGFRAPEDADVREALAAMCEGRRSFAELREAARAGELRAALASRLVGGQSRLLATHAPERVALASGRQARVRYERGQTPWVESRLQDFFGMRETPRVAGGRVAVVVRLLAPNNRPVQVTTDLCGFWERHYPQLRRELGRRYPRHAWPEDPHAAPARERKKIQ